MLAARSAVWAGVAQLVEHLICNQRVGGSNPFVSSIFKSESPVGFSFQDSGCIIYWLCCLSLRGLSVPHHPQIDVCRERLMRVLG